MVYQRENYIMYQDIRGPTVLLRKKHVFSLY